MTEYTRRAVYNVGASITVEIRHDGTVDPETLDDRVRKAAIELLESSGLTADRGDSWAQISADIDGMAPDEETDIDAAGNPIDLEALED